MPKDKYFSLSQIEAAIEAGYEATWDEYIASEFVNAFANKLDSFESLELPAGQSIQEDA